MGYQTKNIIKIYYFDGQRSSYAAQEARGPIERREDIHAHVHGNRRNFQAVRPFWPNEIRT